MKQNSKTLFVIKRDPAFEIPWPDTSQNYLRFIYVTNCELTKFLTKFKDELIC